MPSRRSAWAAVMAAIAVLSATAAGSGIAASDTAPDPIPKKAATLGKGQLWNTPWKLVAYRTGQGYWCEALLRDGISFSACNNVRPVPDPLLITASFNRQGPMPTTVAVIAVSEDVARVRLKLVPGDEPLTRRARPLPERDRRRARLPHGFRFFVIALEKVRGLRAIDAFDRAGHLLGHNEGIPAPEKPPPLE